ncbi:hypothetical protein [Endozoicomonas lisbonensis]
MLRRPPNIPFQIRFKSEAVGYVIRNPFDQYLTANLTLPWGVNASIGVIDTDSNTYPFPVRVTSDQSFFPESVTVTVMGSSYQSEVLKCFSPASPPPLTTVTEATYGSFEGTLV